MKEDVREYMQEFKDDIIYFIVKHPYVICLFFAAIALNIYNYYAFK